MPRRNPDKGLKLHVKSYTIGKQRCTRERLDCVTKICAASPVSSQCKSDGSTAEGQNSNTLEPCIEEASADTTDTTQTAYMQSKSIEVDLWRGMCDNWVLLIWMKCTVITELKYPERLKKLKLPTLVYRRTRGNMIEMFKLITGKYDSHCMPGLD